MSRGHVKNLVTRTIREWMEYDSMTYSAALAYYFVLSLPALLLFSVSIGSILLMSKSVQENILDYLEGVVDESIINMITLLFERIPNIDSLSISALIGFAILLWSASNIFRQLKNFLERAWEIKPSEPNTIKDFVKDAVVSFVIVVFFGGLLALSILVEGLVYTVSRFFQDYLPFSPSVADYAGSIASFLMLVLFFVLVYRLLPDASFDLKSVFVGSLITVILITIGKFAMELYFLYANPGSLYGAIGSIIWLFLLIYYSSVMMTIGAVFTKVYSESKAPNLRKKRPIS